MAHGPLVFDLFINPVLRTKSIYILHEQVPQNNQLLQNIFLLFWQIEFFHVLKRCFGLILFELLHGKTNKMNCVPREDSDQPGSYKLLIECTEKTAQTGQIIVFAGRTGHFVDFVVLQLIYDIIVVDQLTLPPKSVNCENVLLILLDNSY